MAPILCAVFIMLGVSSVEESLSVASPGHAVQTAQTGPQDAQPSPLAGSEGEAQSVKSFLEELERSKVAPRELKAQAPERRYPNVPYYGLGIAVVLLGAALTYRYARSRDTTGSVQLSWVLGAKLIGGYSLVMTLLAGIAVYAILTITAIGDAMQEITSENVPVAECIAEIKAHQLSQALSLSRSIQFGVSDDSASKTAFAHEVSQYESWMQGAQDELNKAVGILRDIKPVDEADAVEMNEALQQLSTIEAEHANFDKFAQHILDLLRAGKFGEVRLLEPRVFVAMEGVNALLEAFDNAMGERVEQAARDGATQQARSRRLLVGCSVATVALGFVLAISLTRSISRPIYRVIASMKGGADQVTSASTQVAQASQSMAGSASEQASSLEETSATLEQMAAMNRQTVESATQANRMAEVANTAAGSGKAAMDRMTEAITKIKSSSDETARIVRTINEIAFQTNLLALNAAVEAARAGEMGKGFAVVAEEVRNLAQRSAQAAENTTALIDESRRNAEHGVEVTDEMGRLLGQITENVQNFSGLVRDLTSATAEQANGIDQINQSVAQMNQVTQSNASGSEESAAAAEELSAQARELNLLVEMLIEVVGGATQTAALVPVGRRGLSE